MTRTTHLTDRFDRLNVSTDPTRGGDPGDERPATADEDRTRAMTRYEEDTARELKERIARRQEASLPPL